MGAYAGIKGSCEGHDYDPACSSTTVGIREPFRVNLVPRIPPSRNMIVLLISVELESITATLA